MAAAIGGSVSMETMGPDVTAALRGLCTALVTSYADEIAEGYAEAQGPARTAQQKAAANAPPRR